MIRSLQRDDSNNSKSNSSLKLALQSKSSFSLRTGMKIRTSDEVLHQIKTRRVQSYQQISFSIRKMNEIFKGKLRDPQKTNPEVSIQENKRFQHSGKKEKLRTCINFYEPIKLKKSLISKKELTQDMKLGQRIKTQHNQQVRKPSHEFEISNTTMFSRQKSILVNTSKLLKNSTQEDDIIRYNKIPGVGFKQSEASCSGEGLSTHHSQSMSSHFAKNTSTYLHFNELLEGDLGQRIESMHQLRVKSELYQPPKQWQFYNCLKLNHVSLYRTNLKISCQNWVLIDYLQLKYLRGYDPKVQKEFNISSILFITCLLMELQGKGLDIQRLKIRINNSLIQKKIQKLSRRQFDYSLENNTIISIRDLFIGLIYTNKVDIIWHFIYLLGYLYRKYNFYIEESAQEVEEYGSYIFIENSSCLRDYESIFISLCRDITNRLNLNSFKLQYKTKKHMIVKKNKLLIGEAYDNSILKELNEYQYLYINSNCVETSILFMECMSFPTFQQLFTQPEPNLTVDIGYQVGFKYWQPRKHEWIRLYRHSKCKDMFLLCGKNIQNPHLSVVCYSKHDDAIVLCNDTKANMAPSDCESVFKWMRGTYKRFQKSSKLEI